MSPHWVNAPHKELAPITEMSTSCFKKGKILFLFSSNPPGLHLPVLHSPSVVVERKPGGPPSWKDISRITSPSPILHSFYSDSSHLISSVHQDWTLETGYLDSFHCLAIQGLLVAASHLHAVVDVHPPLVVVQRVFEFTLFACVFYWQLQFMEDLLCPPILTKLWRVGHSATQRHR